MALYFRFVARIVTELLTPKPAIPLPTAIHHLLLCGAAIAPVASTEKMALLRYSPRTTSTHSHDAVVRFHQRNPTCQWYIETGSQEGVAAVVFAIKPHLKTLCELDHHAPAWRRTLHYRADGKYIFLFLHRSTQGATLRLLPGIELIYGGYVLIPPSLFMGVRLSFKQPVNHLMDLPDIDFLCHPKEQ